MKCEVCGASEREPKLVRYCITLNDQLLVVDHVPAEVCPNCGEESFSPQVVEQVQQTLSGKKRPDRMIETPVYEFVA